MQSDQYPVTEDFQDYRDDGPAKTSTLAIVAFVLSLMLIIGCLIPAAPAIVTLIAVFAFISVLRSNGRKKGIAFASIALVISILASAFQIAIAYGAHRYAQSLSNTTGVIGYAQAGDFDATRSMFSSSLSADLQDDKISSFGALVTDNVGEYQGTPQGLWDFYVSANKDIENTIPNDHLQTVYEYMMENVFSGQPINLVPTFYDNGPALTVLIGETGSNPFNQKLLNVIVVGPDGYVVSMFDSPLTDQLNSLGTEAPPAIDANTGEGDSALPPSGDESGSDETTTEEEEPPADTGG
ncbi:MAG: hypothetical protein Phyf2KO_22740 [Phycisphaerales bacterium]